MQSFDTAAAIAGAPRNMTDPQLKNLLADRVRDWTALGLLVLTTLVLIEVGDTDESVIAEIGFSPLINSLDGKRFGMEGFVLPFDLIEDPRAERLEGHRRRRDLTIAECRAFTTPFTVFAPFRRRELGVARPVRLRADS